jgi:hypothetical protein
MALAVRSRPVGRALRLVLIAAVASGGAGAAQIVQSKITSPVTTAGEGYATRIEWLPGEALVSAPVHSGGALFSGGIFVHAQVGDTWEFRQTLTSPAPQIGASFGHALEASGEWLLTTEPYHSGSGPAYGGAAYVFRRVGGTWLLHQTLIPLDAALPGTQNFGTCAAIDGTTLVVGAQADTSAGTEGGGSVYVFELAGQTWMQKAKLVPDAANLQAGALFGASVALSGQTLVIGATNLDGTSSLGEGAVFTFQRIGGAWVQTQKLVAADAKPHALFGSDLALQGSTLLVAAVGHDHAGNGMRGAVYEFTLAAGTWTQTQELLAPIPGDPSLFGADVGLDADLAVIGSVGDADLGEQAGCAYVFRRASSQWQLFGKALAPDGAAGDVLADEVELRGTRILVSAQGYEDTELNPNALDTGAVYLFEVAPQTLQYGSCHTAGPCRNDDDHGGCASSQGHGAVLAAAGSTSVLEDALALEARWLPPDVFGMLFLGGAEQFLTYGDGRIAVGPGAAGMFRVLPLQWSGPQGAMLWDGGLVAYSQSNPPSEQIEAGDTWYAQVWYRDPSGPCGSGFNFSNGVRIDFVP